MTLLTCLAVGMVLAPGFAAAQDVFGNPLRGKELMVEMKCPQCHGPDGKGRTKTPGVPRIDGQYDVYLRNQLFNFRDGRRPHKFMELYASRLDSETVRDLSAFYSCQGDGAPLVPNPALCDPVR